MLFEISNPSDAYTMKAEDFEAAAIAVCLLGEGKYGLQEIGGDKSVPIFLFGGVNEWFKKNFGGDVEAVYGRANWAVVAEVLDSVAIGSVTDRKIYERTLSELTDEDSKRKFMDVWHDEHRSSMNDIGGYAHQLAARLRKEKVRDTP